jgi:hypothetical protein
MVLTTELLADRTAFLRAYFALLARTVPMVSGAIWVWRNLCSTKQAVRVEGGSSTENNRAKELISELDKRISPFKFARTGGMDQLIDTMYKYLFTWGRFSGNLIVPPGANRVEGFNLIDPFSVAFKKDLSPVIRQRSNAYYEPNPNTFYYYVFGMTLDTAYGECMLEAAKSLIAIADEMLQDMRFSSANAGIPRLHIKVKQPQILPNESSQNYVDRCNTYFDETISEISEVGPYDNFYSWSDVEISIAGGQQVGGFVWKINRQVIDEEITAAFHLFPWVLAKSSSTTKNWVASQFDLLMSQVDSVQKEAKRFAEWIRNTDLALNGLPHVRCTHTFSRQRDPAARELALAEETKIRNAMSKENQGYISHDDAARELGYDSAFGPAPVVAQKRDRGTADVK